MDITNYQDPDGVYEVKVYQNFVKITIYGVIVIKYDGDRRANIFVNGEYGNDASGTCGECKQSWKLCNGKDVSSMPKKARWKAIGDSCIAEFPGFDDTE